MRYQTLCVVEDEEFGGLGLRFEKSRRLCNGSFAIKNGTLLAHDIIEHQQGVQKIGTIGDEMIALGGVCYSRGQWDDIRRNSRSTISPADNIAGDIINMSHLFFERNIPFRQNLVCSRADDCSGILDDVIESARENWELEEIDNSSRDTYLESCRIYMAHGVKLAARRFRSGLLANSMFWEIEDVTTSALKHLDCVGQRFRLAYNFKGTVNFEEVYG